MSPTEPRASGNRWSGLTRAPRGDDYARRFATAAASGIDVHGEATFCARLAPAGGRILDAGCGTGRVAARLAELGFDSVGVDSDAVMMRTARQSTASVRWALADLAALSIAPVADGPFDLIVAAGNVMPLLAPGSEPVVVAALSARLRPGGLLVAGFGLDSAHLPLPTPPFDLVQYDAWCAAAGLQLRDRFSTWAGDPFAAHPDADADADAAAAGYAVSVHVRAPN